MISKEWVTAEVFFTSRKILWKIKKLTVLTNYSVDFPEKPCHKYDVIVTALIDNTVVVAIFTSNLANLKNIFYQNTNKNVI